MIEDYLLQSKCHFCENPAKVFKASLSHGFILMACVDHILDLNGLHEKLISSNKKPFLKKIDSLENILDDVFKNEVHYD